MILEYALTGAALLFGGLYLLCEAVLWACGEPCDDDDGRAP